MSICADFYNRELYEISHKYGEIPWEYYKMIVVEDDGEGNIIAKHFLNALNSNPPN